MATGTAVHIDQPERPPRRSSASRRSRRSRRHSKSADPEEKPAFDVLLSCRTDNPIEDAHSRDIDQLPQHWQPTFISNLSRAASQGLGVLSPVQQQEDRRRFAEEHKPSGSWKRRVFRPAQEQSHTDNFLPRLAFKNPWDSFRAPGVVDMLTGGLKWGLPEGYQEGGTRGKLRGDKPQAAKKVRRQQQAGLQSGLGKGWDHVDVRTPDWGWPGRYDLGKRQTVQEGGTDTEAVSRLDNIQRGKDTDAIAPTASGRANGDVKGNGTAAAATENNTERDSDVSAPADSSAAKPPSDATTAEADHRNVMPEWSDPNNDGVPAARVTWLGHATVLLQLPSLGNEDPEEGVQDKDEDEYRHPLHPTRKAHNGAKTGQTKDGQSTADGKLAGGDVAVPSTVNDAVTMENSECGTNANESAAEKDGNRAGMKGEETSGDDSSTDDEESTNRHRHRQHHTRPRRIPRERIGDRSINILFDPVFSERCSPSQSAGPRRFTPAPCAVEDLPPIDIVCISHSHYDHLDYLTMKALRKQRGRKVHAFVGLGLKDKILEFGWSAEQVSELDWWDSAVLQVHEPQMASVFSNASSTTTGVVARAGKEEQPPSVVESKLVSKIRQDRAKLRLVCTPAQHGSGRGGDKDQTLWCSWVVEWMSGRHLANPSTEQRIPATFRTFFAGDTGLKYHKDSIEKRHKYPPCPAFEEIARRVGRPDLLLLPISVGSSLSYARSFDPFPRSVSPFPRVSAALTSSIHMDPFDAVETHELMRRAGDTEGAGQRKPVSLAVHYGTFVRNEQQTAADVRHLHRACQRWRVPFRRTRGGRFNMSDAGSGQEKGGESGAKEDGDKGLFLVSHQGETVWIPFLWERGARAPHGGDGGGIGIGSGSGDGDVGAEGEREGKGRGGEALRKDGKEVKEDGREDRKRRSGELQRAP